ncbi:MAG: tRNA (adenosine(37)-N6)-dimethylallyltransferase MiaA [Pseudomonadota bacterium]
MNDTRPFILLLVGPTASGKSGLALEVAEAAGAEIVNCDAQQVYRHMDIATGKPSAADRNRLPHHLYDVIAPDEEINASLYAAMADAAIAGIAGRGRVPLVVGGTGLYMRALLHGVAPIPEVPAEVREQVLRTLELEGAGALFARLREVDPEAAERLHPNDAQRVCRALEVFIATGRPLSMYQDEHRFDEDRYPHATFGIDHSHDLLVHRIRSRVDRMFDQGLLDEARGLLERGYPRDLRAFKALGYREIFEVLDGARTEDEAKERLKVLHRQYAKRQRTWFRKEPMTWLDGEDTHTAVAAMIAALPGHPEPGA